MSMESYGGMILTGKNRRTRTESCPSATLSTTNPTLTEPGTNPGLRGKWHVNLTGCYAMQCSASSLLK
jgi:hypothetical protein